MIKNNTILGIDPALTKIGWGVISGSRAKINYIDSGVIKTKSTDSMDKRLAFIQQALEKIILQYNPNIIAVEETFVNMNNVSSLKLAQARGAIMSVIGKYDVKFYEFKPNTIKKTLTGYGHAEKQQILHMVKLIMPASSQIKSSDEADSLAIAYTGLIHSGLR